TFYLAGSGVGSFTSTTDVPRATFGGASAGSVFVAFTGEYDAVKFDSGSSNAFEFSNVSTVPLPASAFLLMAGLGGLAAMRRRKKVA
ncbi:MAG: VPLPA-CTERM sorting domain-containing protein, partial [Rhodobacteraceae bacterium]|nr:VPLPA-CTERM sorting domain-containing protein [Paracoccaceae bacterium]